jgi:hypothetical protein
MFFALRATDGETFNTVAVNRPEALAQFSKRLGVEITDTPTGMMESYMLDEWDAAGVHLVSPGIHIYKKR